jgi:septal ring factor EnvC (AmiA/AmiB activator)
VDGTQVLVATIAGVPAIVAAIFAYRSSAQANKAAEKKVDAEVFERTQGLYEQAIAGAQREIERLQQSQERMAAQLDRMNTQLANEQDTSHRLRGQLAVLQAQVQTMDGIIAALRAQLALLSEKHSESRTA